MGFLSFLFGGGQAKAAKKASKIQMEGFNEVLRRSEGTERLSLADLDQALAAALGNFGDARGALSPYADAGKNALSAYMSVLGLGTPEAGRNVISQLTSAPGYQFGMDQGRTAIERGAAARGGLYSGAAGKELTRYGQDYAGTKLGGVLDRIFQVASGGQRAAEGQASIFGNQANAVLGTGEGKANIRLGVLDAISNAINGRAGAEAGGVLGAANARAGGMQNVLGLLGNVGKFFLGGGLGGLGGGMFGARAGAGNALNRLGYSGLT